VTFDELLPDTFGWVQTHRRGFRIQPSAEVGGLHLSELLRHQNL